MAETTIVLRSDPGIKRDGTKFDGNFYTDGQWVRWQRGLPRKIGGYKTTQKYLTEISRGFSTFTEQDFVYSHSGSKSKLERFTLDNTGNSSIVSDRTPTSYAATGSVTLNTGTAGDTVNTIKVNSVDIMSAAEAFDTSLDLTATHIAANITAHTSTPDYTAVAVGAVITITASTVGTGTNGYTVVSAATGITTTDANMAGGTNDALLVDDNNQWMFDYQYDSSGNQNYILAHVAPNLLSVCNSEGGQIFFGDVLGTSTLTSIALPADANCTGGIVSLHPYLFYYGTDGIIGWSVPGEPTTLDDVPWRFSDSWVLKSNLPSGEA